MNRKRIFTLLVLVVGFMTFASCKGNAKNINNETANSKEATAKQANAPIHITKADFLKKIYNYEASPNEWKYLGDKPAIIDFYADWCGPCRMVAPLLEQLAEEYDGQITVYKIDVDKEGELAAAFGIQGIPALLFIPMNEKPQMFQGALPKDKLKENIEKVLLKK